MFGPLQGKLCILAACGIALCCAGFTSAAESADPQAVMKQVLEEAVTPKEPIKLFNGKDLTGWYTWLKESGREDPKKVFSVVDGMIRISGEGAGYLATEKPYKDYHLSLEYRWGTKTDGSKYVRNSGVLLHAIGPDGGAGGVWMTSIECQLAQGCEGDLIVIRGKDSSGKVIPATITSETIIASDGKTRWRRGGTKTVYSGKQFWWSKHEPGFKELLDTRGKDDVASPLGQWTKVECICVGDRITVKINGHEVNECFDVFPSAGKILLQNEGNEIFFRNVELRPVAKPGAQ
jgi:hypothetical protein